MNVFSYIMGSIFVSASLIAGLILMFFPPKFLSALYGISTKSTKQSKKAWDLGHRVCAVALLVYALFSILAYVPMLVLARGFFDDYAFLRIIFGLLYAVVGVLIAWAVVELELARLGKRKAKIKEQKQEKAKPETLTESVAEIQSEPIAETPVEMISETPAEPIADISIEIAEPSAEPIAEIQSEPISETPAEPITEILAEPIAEIQSESIDENDKTQSGQTSEPTLGSGDKA